MRTDRNIKSKVARISSSGTNPGEGNSGDGGVERHSTKKSRSSKFNNLVAACRKLPSSIEGAYRAASSGVPYYIPGLLLIAMACALILAPNLVLGFCAGLVLYMGLVALYFGRRFRELQGKFADVVKQVEARIYIRGQGPGWNEGDSIGSQGPDKKTVLH